MSGRLEVRRWGAGYAVFDPASGARVSAACHHHALAAAMALRMERRRARRARPCLCCGSTFASDGPHHRLCRNCLARGACGLDRAWLEAGP